MRVHIEQEDIRNEKEKFFQLRERDGFFSQAKCYVET